MEILLEVKGRFTLGFGFKKLEGPKDSVMNITYGFKIEPKLKDWLASQTRKSIFLARDRQDLAGK